MGLSGPRTERQTTSFSKRSSTASSRAKFILILPPHACALFRSSKSTLAGSAWQGRKSGLAWNELNIGVAAASYCDIGVRPRISSIVRNMLLVEYIVESTTPHFV